MTLKIEKLSKAINKKWILSDLNIEVLQSECLAILGPSGCGKSSTLRLIAGLDKPTEGRIFINSVDVTNISPVQRKIGMVFQSYALFPHLTVTNNLSIGLKVRGVSTKEQKNRIANILSVMQLEDLADRFPSELSGGQRQRVALSRALLRDPFVYLLDEPMSNLDAQLREELRPQIRNLILKKQQPVLYVTHDQHEAMAIADRIAVLKEGKLQQIGTPQELYKKPKSIFVAGFIGRPQINILPATSGVVRAIRPEHINIVQEGIKCKLIDKEWLGLNQLLFLDSPLGKLKLLCGANNETFEDIEISWDPINEHQFNSYSGIRLT